MKLTKKIALDAAITAMYNNINHSQTQYHIAGEDNNFSAYEIIKKLQDMYKELKEDE